MKQLFVFASLLALSMMAHSRLLAAEDTPCTTEILTCCDGSMHTVMICEEADEIAWDEILCTTCTISD